MEAPRYLLVPSADAKVLTIDSIHDARSFLGTDFQMLAFMGYDAIHYTQRAARLDLLKDWECESVFWMRWAFDEVRRLQ